MEKLPQVLLAMLLAFSAVITLRAPFVEYGDAREYVIQTQSIIFDRSLAVDTGKRAGYFNAGNPFGLTLTARPSPGPYDGARLTEQDQSGGGFGGLYPDKAGNFHYIHSWFYSLAASPVYILLHRFSLEYYAFRVLNLLLFFLAITLLWRHHPGSRSLVFFALSLATPITAYLCWIHSEIYCFSLTVIAFALVRSKIQRWSPVPLGLAAAQNIPIILFFPALLWILRRNGCSVRGMLLPCFTALLFPFVSLFYFKWHFGVWSLYTALQTASLNYTTPGRVVGAFFSPLYGALWYFPLLFLLLPSRFSRNNWTELTLLILSVVAVAALSVSTANLSSAQVGALRYASWFAAPLFPALLHYETKTRSLEAAGVLASLLIILYFHTYELAYGGFTRFSSAASRPEAARLYEITHYQDDAEVIAEFVRKKEFLAPLQFDGVYIWNLGPRSSMWLVSKRAVKNLRFLKLDRAQDPGYSVSPAQKKRKIFSEFENSLYLVPNRVRRYHDHPVLGGYIYIWFERATMDVTSSEPVHILNSFSLQEPRS